MFTQKVVTSSACGHMKNLKLNKKKINNDINN